MATVIQEIKVNDIVVPIIIEQDKRLPLATVQFVFKNSGSISDEKKVGLARFCAKVMNEGTLKLGSNAFAEALEAKAIHISATAGKETFVVELGSLKGQLDEGLGYFDRLLQDPNLSEDVISKVKTTTIGSISSKVNDYDYVASNALKAMLFNDTPMANNDSGTIESVKSIELSDVKEFLSNHLVGSNLVVMVGGDVEIEDIKVKISKIIANIKKGTVGSLKHHEVVVKPSESVIKKETQQAYIYFGSPYNMRVDFSDNYKARVASYILGAGGFGSRLMEEIRVKKGLAYSAYAKTNVSQSSSYMSGYLQTKLESQEDAKKSVKEVIENFVKNGVTKDELEQTKKFMLGSEPLRVETMSQRLSRAFMEFYDGRELGHSLKELELIKNLKLDDLNSFIKEHTEIQELSFSIVTK
ncbi:pitrilysin family protein [Sulfurimonas sp.]|uniref:M16 family metallopeptidase n=1 Tax=Sulfurimonas sp. TaxID=2022749 RepID=UPI00260AC249|nr:pitrilysin family protein [Sulfurimonas sp.]MDD5158064.1 pitrilysin family protein [Sulfurimonas sp.]